MISKKKTRKSLAQAFLQTDPQKKITWEIADFRHAVLNTVDNCVNISKCTWKIDKKKKRLYCTLGSSNTSFLCSYDVDRKSVFLQKVKMEMQYGKKVPVVDQVKYTTCEEMPSIIKSWQPKKVIVLKRAK